MSGTLLSGTVVIGLGNASRRDDGAGLLVAQAVRERALPGVEVRLNTADTTALLDAWEDAALAVVIDAVSSGAAPGTLHRLDSPGAHLPVLGQRGSTHALGLAEAIALGQALGRLPERLIVYGIEGADFGFGDTISPAVRTAVAEAITRILREVGDA
jgi:hydrogenase maturation protease